jgi:hypothetical protein
MKFPRAARLCVSPLVTNTSAASGTDYVNAVPEPSQLALLLSSLVVVGFAVRRKGKARTP